MLTTNFGNPLEFPHLEHRRRKESTMNQDTMTHIRKEYNETTHGFSFRLKNGDFYRECKNRGSWSPATRKQVTVKNLAVATLFFTPDFSQPPYDMPYMQGGKWIKVQRKTTINWEPL